MQYIILERANALVHYYYEVEAESEEEADKLFTEGKAKLIDDPEIIEVHHTSHEIEGPVS